MKVRVSAIDVDFQDTRRSEVKEYLTKRYKHVASIATYAMFKDKNVIKDAARVFKVPIGEVNTALKPVATFEDYLDSPNTEDFRKKYPEVTSLATSLRGRVRSSGMHASGFVVSSQPIENYLPIETAKDTSSKNGPRIPVVAADMDEVAGVGMIKLDVLGLKALTIIDDTVRAIKESHGRDLDMASLPLIDPKIYEDLSNGYTRAIFQAEQPAYTSMLVRMGVRSFAELAASNALVRPGAMATIGALYMLRKSGAESVQYIHNLLKPFTEETYGCVLYQEQVMLACVELGGMTMREADKVRKIIGKKKDVHEFDQFKEKFVTGASVHITKQAAEKLWHDFEAHAGYSFNKCVSGETTVRRSASGRFCKDPDISVKALYELWNSSTAVGKKYRSRGLKIMSMDADGKVRPNRVVGVHQNGVRETFRVTLSNGAFIDATANHRHLTTFGYKRVDELSVGDEMLYSAFEYEPTVRPVGIGSGWAAKTSERSVASDGRLRPSLGGHSSEYTRNVGLLTDDCANCGRSDGRLEVAHLNSDNRDSRLANLARLCNSCHKTLDYKFGSRKKRSSKGYAVERLKVVSIVSNGLEMTYDVEMDTVEHNWLANGIVTHNSHAVAYSMITYWTAWLKHYYPREFMFSVLKNEGDKDARTEYLIECKRLGLKVYLPDVNKSGLGFTLEPDGIRFGLSDIKYISDSIGEKIINLRPFTSYANLLEKSQEKFSGVNSRAIAALNSVGAAVFEDNPRSGKERDNFYEYLSIPSFGTAELDPRLRAYSRTIDEYEENGAFIVIGMVRKIVRKPGWARAEVVDETGSAGIFTDENTPMEAGNMYVMLVSNNRIARYTAIDEVDEDNTSSFVQFLYRKYPDPAEGTHRVIAFNSRTTKAGKKMADVVLADHLNNMVPALVFPAVYPKVVSKMREGRLVVVELRETEDGSTTFVHSA